MHSPHSITPYPKFSLLPKLYTQVSVCPQSCKNTLFPCLCYTQGSKQCPLTCSTFLNMLKSCLTQLGIDTTQYSCHSFRRGGVCFALECRLPLPPDLIKVQGDWKSDAYHPYLDPSLSFCMQVAEIQPLHVPTFLALCLP